MIYNLEPTIGDPQVDPGYTGLYWIGQNYDATNAAGNLVNTFDNCFDLGTDVVNNTVWLVPVTVDASTQYDGNNDNCYDVGPAIEVTYLKPTKIYEQQDCSGVQLTFDGGFPEFFGGLYSLNNLGAGTLSATTVSYLGQILITDINPGETYSIQVTDPNGCPQNVTGVYDFEEPVVDFSPILSSVCTNEADIVFNREPFSRLGTTRGILYFKHTMGCQS